MNENKQADPHTTYLSPRCPSLRATNLVFVSCVPFLTLLSWGETGPVVTPNTILKRFDHNHTGLFVLYPGSAEIGENCRNQRWAIWTKCQQLLPTTGNLEGGEGPSAGRVWRAGISSACAPSVLWKAAELALLLLLPCSVHRAWSSFSACYSTDIRKTLAAGVVARMGLPQHTDSWRSLWYTSYLRKQTSHGSAVLTLLNIRSNVTGQEHKTAGPTPDTSSRLYPRLIYFHVKHIFMTTDQKVYSEKKKRE